jgi:hypothetical protein
MADVYHFFHIHSHVYAENCRPVGRQFNGFMRGPAFVEVNDPSKPAHVTATGGDHVNGRDGGRVWYEEAWFLPGLGWRRCFCSGGDYQTIHCADIQRDMRALRARLEALRAEAEADGDDHLARVYADLDAAIVAAAAAGDAPRLRYALMRARMSA